MNLKRIGLDTSKAVFTLHGVDQDEKAVLRRNIRRAELEAFFTKLPSNDKQMVKMSGLAHTALLGINRHKLYHAMYGFMTMPDRVPFGSSESAKPSKMPM